MLESDRTFTKTIIHICESIFYKIHLMRMKLPFPLLKASSQVLLGLKYFEKNFFHNFHQKKGVDFAFAGCCI